jgi:hypothetical protein
MQRDEGRISSIIVKLLPLLPLLPPDLRTHFAVAVEIFRSGGCGGGGGLHDISETAEARVPDPCERGSWACGSTVVHPLKRRKLPPECNILLKVRDLSSCIWLSRIITFSYDECAGSPASRRSVGRWGRRCNALHYPARLSHNMHHPFNIIY